MREHLLAQPVLFHENANCVRLLRAMLHQQPSMPVQVLLRLGDDVGQITHAVRSGAQGVYRLMGQAAFAQMRIVVFDIRRVGHNDIEPLSGHGGIPVPASESDIIDSQLACIGSGNVQGGLRAVGAGDPAVGTLMGDRQGDGTTASPQVQHRDLCVLRDMT